MNSQIHKLSTRFTGRLPSAHWIREPKALTAFPHVGEKHHAPQ